MDRMSSLRGTVWLGAGLAVVVGAVQGVHGQEPRVRNLAYDPEKKEWVELAPPPLGTAEGDLRAIRARVSDRDYATAQGLIKGWVKQYGDSHELYPDVLIARAQSLIGRREYYEAHLALQTFLSQFAGSPLSETALRLEFVVAETFLGGVKRKVWGMRVLSGEELALKILDEISSDYPVSRVAELALKTKADYFFRTGDHDLAEDEYARLLREHPRSQYHRFAWRRTADAALASFGGVEYDEAALIEAEERYREYHGRFPTEAEEGGVSLILDRILELRAEKEFAIGQYYERTEHITSAVYYYKMVHEQFPDSIAAARATARLEALGAVASRTRTNDGTGPERTPQP